MFLFNDVFGHITFTSLITLGFLESPLLFWASLVWCVQHRRLVTDKLVEQKWLNVFEVLKCLSVLFGCVLFTFYKYTKWYSYDLLYYTLLVNILEASLAEIHLSFSNVMNGFVAFVLAFSIPYDPINPSNVFSFALNGSWILLYMSWNAVFTYRMGFSWSTRLILFVPLVISCLLGTTEYWLVARTFSLSLNMILRSTEFCRFYNPGSDCFITESTNQPNMKWYYIASVINLVLCVSPIGIQQMSFFLQQ